MALEIPPFRARERRELGKTNPRGRMKTGERGFAGATSEEGVPENALESRVRGDQPRRWRPASRLSVALPGRGRRVILPSPPFRGAQSLWRGLGWLPGSEPAP